MRRITLLSLLALTLFGGVASADRDRGRERDRSHRAPGGVVVRDHRTHDRPVRYERQRGHRYHHDNRPRYQNRVRWDRRPIYVSNGRFQFNRGYSRAYTRPVINYRYYDYRVRPQIIVENYDTVPGYLWVQGQWQWNGREWLWTSGHYAPDPAYADQNYAYDTDGDGYADDYNGDGYPDNSY